MAEETEPERDALLLELGALVYELHRRGERAPELLQEKAAELDSSYERDNNSPLRSESGAKPARIAASRRTKASWCACSAASGWS